MANFNTNGISPQIGGKLPDSITSNVCFTESWLDKNFLWIIKNKTPKRRLQQKTQKLTNLSIGTYNIRSTDDRILQAHKKPEEKLNKLKLRLPNIYSIIKLILY